MGAAWWGVWALAFIVFAPPVLVAVGLPFRRSLGVRVFDDGRVADNYELPDWLLWLQNPEDHLTGDRRGWFWYDSWAADYPELFRMWWWSGWRNPWNHFKRKVLGIDVRKFDIVKVCGADYVRDDLTNQGFQILVAWPKDGWFPRPMLYWVREIHNGRGICLQLGWKIRLAHNSVRYAKDIDYFVGFTFEPNPYKDLA